MLVKKKKMLPWFFWEVENVELEHVLAFLATFYSEAKWNKVMHEAWKRQVFEAGSWNHLRGRAGAVRRELRDAYTCWPSSDVLSVDGKLIDCRIPCALANCPGIVSLTAGTLFSLTLIVLPGTKILNCT